jgi:hypothetical protein
MLVGLLIGAVAVLHAYRQVAMHDPPSGPPSIQLALSAGTAVHELSWANNIEYQVSEKFRPCHNPVTVEFDALINGQDVGPTTAPGFADGELVDPLGAVDKVFPLDQSGMPSQLGAARGEFVQKIINGGAGGVAFGAPIERWYPSGFGPLMGPIHSAILVLKFKANWVLPRNSSSCFVRFPSLAVLTSDPARPANSVNPVAPAGPGEVSISSLTGGIADWQDSFPTPTDPLIPQWRCPRMYQSADEVKDMAPYADCSGGFAIYNVPGASSRVPLWLLIDGALIGVAAGIVAEPAIEFRWRGKR